MVHGHMNRFLKTLGLPLRSTDLHWKVPKRMSVASYRVREGGGAVVAVVLTASSHQRTLAGLGSRQSWENQDCKPGINGDSSFVWFVGWDVLDRFTAFLLFVLCSC